MNERVWDRTLLLTAVAVAIISAVSVWLAWQTSADLAQRISIAAVAPILSAALVSYSLRILRFHYFLTRSGVALSFRETAVVQAVGFALSVTPGHIGEVFKLHLIRERVGTPLMQTAPLLVLDRFTEGGGFMILALASALLMPALRAEIPTPSLLLLGLGAIVAFALVRYGLGHKGARDRLHLPHLPAVRQILPHLKNLWRGLESSFTVSQIIGGLALSTVARFADGLVVLFAARMLGIDLPLAAAVFVLAVSGLAGGISFLPAGTGAVETTMVGLLTLLLGVTLPNALAITLLSRLSTLWLWVALGLGVAFFRRFTSARVHV
jgi:uncharacterized protein (TIRG00374 family)